MDGNYTKGNLWLKTSNFWNEIVSTAYGGDSFLLCYSKDFNLKIIPENAKKFVEIAKLLLKDANKQIGFQHPKIKELNYISFCQFMDPLTLDKKGIKSAKNTVVIRPGKLDRSPCGTGTCAKMASLFAKNKLKLDSDFVHEGILGTTFTGKLIRKTKVGNYEAVIPTITGRAWITGFAQYVLDENDPFPEGYTIGDIWGGN